MISIFFLNGKISLQQIQITIFNKTSTEFLTPKNYFNAKGTNTKIRALQAPPSVII